MGFRKFLIALGGSMLIPLSVLYSQKRPFVSLDVQPGAGCSIFIQWEVLAEMDTAKFEVEKSRDKLNWFSITHRSARPPHRYLFVDDAPGDSINYYRVKQIGNGDSSIYSDTKWVQVNITTDVFIWPDPTADIIYVRSPFLSGTIDITDANGRMVRKLLITDFVNEIYMAGFAKEIYFLKIQSGNRVLTEKFTRE